MREVKQNSTPRKAHCRGPLTIKRAPLLPRCGPRRLGPSRPGHFSPHERNRSTACRSNLACNCARRASAADRLLNLAFDASRRVWPLITYQKDEPSKRSPYVESLHGRGLGFRGRRLNSATRTASRPCLLCHQILIVRSAARIAACRVPSIDPCLGLGDEWTIQTHWFFPMALLIS